MPTTPLLDEGHMMEPPVSVPMVRAARLAAATAARLESYWRTGAAVELMATAGVLEESGDWRDPRAEQPWAQAAAALMRAAESFEPPRRRRLLDLAAALLEAPPLRLRGITSRRILEGLVFRHLSEPPQAS